MKTHLKILVSVTIFAVLAIAVLIVGIFNRPETGRHKLTKEQAQELLEKVGGIEQVNKEAQQIFARFGEKKMDLLNPSDLKDYPAITSLGEVLGIWPEIFGFPTHIRIRLGDHWNVQHIYILSTNSMMVFNSETESNSIKIGQGIFITQ